jgi:polyisoprenoid-binding protein YceI
MQTAERMLTQTGSYVIDPIHSFIGFATHHAAVAPVRGCFGSFEGIGYFDIERPESSMVDITIEASSIDTRHRERDAHLRSSDFLDVTSHPVITFSATSVDQIGVRSYRVTGDLVIKGITNPVVIEADRTGWVVEPDGSQRVGFEGRAVISRKDWGIGWNQLLDADDALTSDHITVEFDISATKSACTT